MNNKTLRKKIFRNTLFIAIMFSILLPFLCNKFPVFGLSLNNVIFKIIAPVQNCTHRIVSVIFDTIENYVFLVSTAKENKMLKKELASIKMIDNEYIKVKMVNSVLRDLLAFKKSIFPNTLAAEIVSKNTSHMSSVFIINKGSGDGITEGSSVIAIDGIVGTIIKVTDNYSQVMSIADPRSSIDAFINSKGSIRIIRLVAEGCGNGLCSLEYPSRKCNINVGDVVVSSGLDKVFPKDMNVGIVSKVVKSVSSGMLETVLIKPYVDLNLLKNVLVITSNHNV